jgi:uncharacterized protein YbjT (DUF2867 family)
MSDLRTILVTGATGAQGGSVARHLLRRGTFAVRALTRKPDSEKAALLREAGAEIVQADLEDIMALRTVMEGCYGVFGVTNYWEHFDGEFRQGRNLVDAVAASKTEHFVFSTLPYAKKISKGVLEVAHLDVKGRLEEYARTKPVSVTFVHPAFYYENFLSYFSPRRRSGGDYAFGFPQGDTPLAGVAVGDLGGVVAAIFERRDEFLCRTVGIAGDDLPPARYADLMAGTLGLPITYHHIPREVFAGLEFPGAADLANMFEFNRIFCPSRAADVALSRQLYPAIRPFRTWLGENRQRFQPLLAA